MTITSRQQADLPQLWKVGDHEYKVGCIAYAQVLELNAHLQEVIPDPITKVKQRLDKFADCFDAEQRKQFMVEAYRKADTEDWPPTFDSQAGVNYYFYNPEGVAYFVKVVLSRFHPEITVEDVKRDILPHMTEKHMIELQSLMAVRDVEDTVDQVAKQEGLLTKAPAQGPVQHTEMEEVTVDEAPKA